MTPNSSDSIQRDINHPTGTPTEFPPNETRASGHHESHDPRAWAPSAMRRSISFVRLGRGTRGVRKGRCMRARGEDSKYPGQHRHHPLLHDRVAHLGRQRATSIGISGNFGCSVSLISDATRAIGLATRTESVVCRGLSRSRQRDVLRPGSALRSPAIASYGARHATISTSLSPSMLVDRCR